MKRIRSMMVLAGLSVAFLVLGTTGASAQGFTFTSTQFAGTFTLHNEAQWGAMTLPAGDYNLSFGLTPEGRYAAYIIGKAKGSPKGFILAWQPDPSSAAKDSLICVRVGNTLVVRKLEMQGVGESVSFPMPHGMKLLAHRQKHGKYTLAEASTLIERVPVTLNGK